MNIKEVAQEAGVSVATISRVLNGSEKVNPKTRQKVTKIIKIKFFIFSKVKRDKTTWLQILVPFYQNQLIYLNRPFK